MNSKELTSKLRNRLQVDENKVEKLLETAVKVIETELLSNNSVGLQGFGTFEIRKKEERISVNPTTQERMLIPPKLTLAFKPSTVLKERIKQHKQ